MSAESALTSVLLAASAVTAIAGQRIRSDKADETDAQPLVVFSRTGSEPTVALDGTHLRTRVALDVQCWAQTRTAADSLADAVSTAIRAQTSQAVVGRAGAYDPEVGAHVSVLNVLWWE